MDRIEPTEPNLNSIPNDASTALAKRLAFHAVRVQGLLKTLYRSIADGKELAFVQGCAAVAAFCAPDFETSAHLAFSQNPEKKAAATALKQKVVELSKQLHEGVLAPVDALSCIKGTGDEVWKIAWRDPKDNRHILMARVALLLKEHGDCEALEYRHADSEYGWMNGDPVGAVRFTEQGDEPIPVGPSRKYKSEFCIDEANGQAIVSYADIQCLSGWGGTWKIKLDGTVVMLSMMMS